MHMNTSYTNRGRVEVEVDAPQRGTERVGQTRFALIVKGVGLTKDQRYAATCAIWPNLLVLSNMSVHGVLC